MNREDYERDLKRRQADHLSKLANKPKYWTPCAHDQCSRCVGTGIDMHGAACVHAITCYCVKCSPFGGR